MPTPIITERVQNSLSELNLRFLELLATDHHEAAVLSGDMRLCLTQMSIAQRAAVADCPYALFDVRFQDEVHWSMRLSDAQRWQVAEVSVAGAEAVNFVRLALFYAWHVAHSAKLAARVQLGMNESVVTAFRSTTLDRLPALAVSEAAYLSVKWSANAAYWGLLTRAAATADTAALRRVQLYGLQLSAASRLTTL